MNGEDLETWGAWGPGEWPPRRMSAGGRKVRVCAEMQWTREGTCRGQQEPQKEGGARDVGGKWKAWPFWLHPLPPSLSGLQAACVASSLTCPHTLHAGENTASDRRQVPAARPVLLLSLPSSTSMPGPLLNPSAPRLGTAGGHPPASQDASCFGTRALLCSSVSPFEGLALFLGSPRVE